MVSPNSATHLLATINGLTCEGPHFCFYCGAPCAENHPTKIYVKKSFTGYTTVTRPGSSFVCHGCVIALNEKASITLINGEERTGQMTRGYSWILTDKAIAATKAHITELRGLCLNPPEPPYSIILATSGQKHLLYRGRVNWDREHVTVSLEEELITYTPSELQERLEVVGHLVAATGKPALAERPNTRFGVAILERYPERGEELLRTWERAREEGLSRLAAFLSPAKVECQELYPEEHQHESEGGL